MSAEESQPGLTQPSVDSPGTGGPPTEGATGSGVHKSRDDGAAEEAEAAGVITEPTSGPTSSTVHIAAASSVSSSSAGPAQQLQPVSSVTTLPASNTTGALQDLETPPSPSPEYLALVASGGDATAQHQQRATESPRVAGSSPSSAPAPAAPVLSDDAHQYHPQSSADTVDGHGKEHATVLQQAASDEDVHPSSRIITIFHEEQQEDQQEQQSERIEREDEEEEPIISFTVEEEEEEVEGLEEAVGDQEAATSYLSATTDPMTTSTSTASTAATNEPVSPRSSQPPAELRELTDEEKQRALEAMREAFNSSHTLHVEGIESDISPADLVPIFSQFGKVNSIVVEPSRRDVAIVRMPFEAAERAKEHFATTEPLKVKDKELKVSDARYVESFLFVGNLNDDVEPEHLHALFQAHGQTERAIVMRSSRTGRKKGYGFVEMRMKAQAGAAKAVLGGYGFHGRSLRIDWCRLNTLEDLHSPVLFVDKLPPGLLDYGAFKKLFQDFGTVKNVNVPINPMNQLPRGFAFVTFTTGEEAEKARDGLHNAEFQGTRIRISYGNPSKSDIASGNIVSRFAPVSLPRGAGFAHRGGFGSSMFFGRGRGFFPSLASARPGWGRSGSPGGFPGVLLDHQMTRPGFAAVAGRGFGPSGPRGGPRGLFPSFTPVSFSPPTAPRGSDVSGPIGSTALRPSHPISGGSYRPMPAPTARPTLPTAMPSSATFARPPVRIGSSPVPGAVPAAPSTTVPQPPVYHHHHHHQQQQQQQQHDTSTFRSTSSSYPNWETSQSSPAAVVPKAQTGGGTAYGYTAQQNVYSSYPQQQQQNSYMLPVQTPPVYIPQVRPLSQPPVAATATAYTGLTGAHAAYQQTGAIPYGYGSTYDQYGVSTPASATTTAVAIPQVQQQQPYIAAGAYYASAPAATHGKIPITGATQHPAVSTTYSASTTTSQQTHAATPSAYVPTATGPAITSSTYSYYAQQSQQQQQQQHQHDGGGGQKRTHGEMQSSSIQAYQQPTAAAATVSYQSYPPPAAGGYVPYASNQEPWPKRPHY